MSRNYFENYHFHPESPQMGFCEGKIHTDESVSNLLPQNIDNSDTQYSPLDKNTKFKKQIDIFKDDNGNIYIKPNEILKLIGSQRGKYILRIHFLRNIKSELGNFLHLMKNNLIENGNFFAGLEATQTGDLDRSIGKNNFYRIKNPGFCDYVLQQNGLMGNEYRMKVTGIEPSSSYIFSCWVAWNQKFNGASGLVSFDNTSSQGGLVGLPAVPNTDLRGTASTDLHSNDEWLQRILQYVDINGLNWYKVYSFVQTDENSDLGSIIIRLGSNFGDYNPSSDPLGNRYFTDLRFEKVDSLIGSPVLEYLNKLKTEPITVRDLEN